MELILAILGGFLSAPLAYIAHKNAARAVAPVMALVPLAIFVYFATWVPTLLTQGPQTLSLEWVPALGVRFAFLVDGLSLTFALLISGIGTGIVLYAGGYLKGHARLGSFIAFLLMFMASMLGLVLASDLITLFIFWELTSITSFLLIGFDHTRQASRRAAVQALVVTGGGGLALLAGIVLLILITGQTDLATILQGDAAAVLADPLAGACLVLLLVGAFTKSAQVPFHFWLPNAMEAPTPVSAFLHSATMVKAGVYLVARLHPLFAEHALWFPVLAVFGGATLVAGGLLAVRQHDLKLMLAYTTVASLGLLIMMLSGGSEKMVLGATLYLVAHALFKACLFMIAGGVDHEAGTRDIRLLGGLRRAMPLTFVAAGLAALSMSGVIATFGFVAKEILYAATTHEGVAGWIITLALLAGNALMGGVALGIVWYVFFGPKVSTPKHAHDGPWLLWIGPLVLAVLGVVFGVLPALTAGEWLILPMATAIFGQTVDYTLKPYPYEFLPFALSMLTLGLAVLLARALVRARAWVDHGFTRIGWGPDLGFDQAVRGILGLASLLRLSVQTGMLRTYILVLMLTLAGILSYSVLRLGTWPDLAALVGDLRWDRLNPYELVLLGLALVGALAVLTARTKIQALISVSVVGISIGLVFMALGAPDLAFTQLMVEVLSAIILTLVLIRLPLDRAPMRASDHAARDFVISLVIFFGLFGLLASVTALDLDLTLSQYFGQTSYIQAHGRNVVNVILVDYRALDTLGEICVVLVTGLAASLLMRHRGTGSAKAKPEVLGAGPAEPDAPVLSPSATPDAAPAAAPTIGTTPAKGA